MARRLQERIADLERCIAQEQDDEQKRRLQAEIDAARTLEREGFGYAQSDLDSSAGGARGEGRTAGERAARERQAERLGVSVDDLDAELDRIARQRREEQSELERAQADRQAREQERDQATQRAERAEARWRDSVRREAVRDALIAAGLRPDRASVALRVADSESVEVSDEGVAGDASAAVEAVRSAEPDWFRPPPPERDVPDTPQSGRRNRSQGRSAAAEYGARAYRRPGQQGR